MKTLLKSDFFSEEESRKRKERIFKRYICLKKNQELTKQMLLLKTTKPQLS